MHLALCALQEVCETKLGQSRSRLQLYSFEEVQAANAAHNCWLILDGKPHTRTSRHSKTLACLALCPPTDAHPVMQNVPYGET